MLSYKIFDNVAYLWPRSLHLQPDLIRINLCYGSGNVESISNNYSVVEGMKIDLIIICSQ